MPCIGGFHGQLKECKSPYLVDIISITFFSLGIDFETNDRMETGHIMHLPIMSPLHPILGDSYSPIQPWGPGSRRGRQVRT